MTILFLLQNRFLALILPSSTDVDKILHTPSVVWNAPVLDRDRRVGGSRPSQSDCFFSVEEEFIFRTKTKHKDE